MVAEVDFSSLFGSHGESSSDWTQREADIEGKEADLLAALERYSDLHSTVLRHLNESRLRAQRIVELRERKRNLLHQNNMLQRRLRELEGEKKCVYCTFTTNETIGEKDMNSFTFGDIDFPASDCDGELDNDGNNAWRDGNSALLSLRSHPYRYCGPAVDGIVRSVFPQGLLYRIITRDGSWAFYNDTRHFEMHVVYTVWADSPPTPGPSASMTALTSGGYNMKLILPPCATAVLLKGVIMKEDNLSQAVPIQTHVKEVLNAKDPSFRQLSAMGLLAKEIVNTEKGKERDLSERLIQSCLTQQIPFVDLDFPPRHVSLFRVAWDAFFIPPLCWKRPSMYLHPGRGAASSLCIGLPSPLHVEEGEAFPDLSFLSAVAVLAEYPTQIQRLFRHPKGASMGRLEHQFGAYRVSLSRNGWWRVVVVDDFLPAAENGLEFSRCRDNAHMLWLPLLEKAYAKLLGSYAAILSLPLPHVLSDLSGWPCASIDHCWTGAPNASQALYETIYHFQRYGEACVVLRAFAPPPHAVSLCNESVWSVYDAIGLRPGCAYAVVHCRMVSGVPLLCLRGTHFQRTASCEGGVASPLGWVTHWADRPWLSALLTSEQERAANAHLLWMEARDAVSLFRGGLALYARPDWTDVRIWGVFKDGKPLVSVRLEVRDAVRVLLTLSQDDTDANYTVDAACVVESTVDDFAREHSKDWHAVALTLVHTKKGAFQFLRSSGTPVMHSSDASICFVSERDVSLGLTLRPEESPYVLIPHVLDNLTEMNYVLGILCISMDVIQTEFVSVKPTANVFQTTHGVVLKETDLFPVSTDYQCRHPKKRGMQFERNTNKVTKVN